MDEYGKLIFDMNDHAFREYPLEAVGIITMDYKYVPALNISSTPMINFEFDSDVLEVYSDNISKKQSSTRRYNHTKKFAQFWDMNFRHPDV